MSATKDPSQAYKPRPIVGWREWASLPGLGVHNIKVKVDTGARTSALHADAIEVISDAQPARVRFRVYATDDDNVLLSAVERPLLALREIKSSNGQVERRPVIATKIQLGTETWTAEVTLTTREEMGFRMLLGREALRRRFWVDAGRSFVCGPSQPLCTDKEKQEL